MKINTIIVDDEPLSRQGIRLRLEHDKDINIIDECPDGKSAEVSINKLKPDLVYLDIQMPEMDGFELIRRIQPEHFPFIIFTTAYDKYAIKAFEINALDYLLKPVSDERFCQALNRAKEEILKRNLLTFSQKISVLVDNYSNNFKIQQQDSRWLERLVIKSKGTLSFVKTNEIEWIQAAGDYVYLYVNNKKFLHRETMTNLEQNLNPLNFKRIHRSAIVNTNLIKQIVSSDHGDYKILLLNGTKLKLSRNYKENLNQFLNFLH